MPCRRTPSLAAVLFALTATVTGCASRARPVDSAGRLAASVPAGPVSTPSVTGEARTGVGLRGLGVTPVPRKPALVLRDTSGSSYDLRSATRGRLTYLYFGYTHCPDACPTTMADLASALREVGPAVRRSVAVVFVTTDPVRDTAGSLRAWLDRFDPTFVGVTGTPDQIAAAERRAGVPLAVPESDGHGGYGVTHSTEVFAFSPDGLSHVVYADGFAPADYAHDMPLLLGRRS